MTKIKKISFFVLILSWALYDSLGTGAWNTNAAVMFYSVFYAFVLIHLFSISINETMKEKIVLYCLSIPIVFRLILELTSINKTYEQYRLIMENAYLDFLTWMVLAISLVLSIWANYRKYSQD